MDRLAVIVPYRNRKKQLEKFIDHTSKYLSNREFEYYIIVVEQYDDKEFNRGKLLNIGFKEAVKRRCDYVVFHDVDMLPEKVDYSYSDIPIHLATDNLPFEHYFGGITLFPIDLFERINGFSNVYWGWGFEDDDLRYRCIKNDIPLVQVSQTDSLPPRTDLKFNGVDAYIKCKNTLDINESFTINIKFTPEAPVYNHRKDIDKFTLFNIPEYDFSINYTSFSRYQVEFFDNRQGYHHLYSKILPAKPITHDLTVTYNKISRKVSLYINSKLIDNLTIDTTFFNYNDQPNFYLGGKKGELDFFKGAIKEFSTFNKCLTKREIVDLHNNKCFSLTQNFKNYKSSNYLKTFYDTKFVKDYKLIDLSGNGNVGEIVNCEIIKSRGLFKHLEYLPYRRPSSIRKLAHSNNGFIKGKWKSKSTRWNQLRYNNEVLTDNHDTDADGLSNLTFEEVEYKKLERVIYIKAKL